MLLSKTGLNLKTRKITALLDKTFTSYQLFNVNNHPVLIIDGLDNFMHEQLAVQTIWPADKNMPVFLDTIAKSIVIDTPHLIDTVLRTYVEAYVRPLGHHRAIHSMAFNTGSSYSGNIWHHGSVYTLFIKGAPEEVLSHSELTENEREQATIKLHSLATHGHKVLAFAHTMLDHAVTNLDDLPAGTRLTFDGFVSFRHTLKRTHGTALEKLHELGVRTLVLTKEHAETGYAVAREVGIVSSPNQLLDGKHIHTINDHELYNLLLTTRLITRITAQDREHIATLLAKQTQ